VFGLEFRNELVDRDIELRLIFDWPGDNQRRARFVDQDRVDLVDDGEVVPVLL